MFTVDQFEHIRRKFFIDQCSQREIARELGCSRHTVAKAVGNPAPAPYRLTAPKPRPTVDPFQAIIEAWQKQDEQRPRKQRHTAQRIYERLRDEHGYTGSYSAVSRYVARTRGVVGEVFMPLEFGPGEEAQVDWGEGWIIENGTERTAQFFCMRLASSRASFIHPYQHQNLESFLDGHVRAFQFFGGVPRRLAYDNLKTAVIHVGRGRERQLTQRFLELRSHYLFESRFCNVARGNEKGHVENLVKFTERTVLTPLPEVTGLPMLAEYVTAKCQQALDRSGSRDGRTVRELLVEERPCLLPLPERPFAACCTHEARASKQSLVRFADNDYSVPTEYAYRLCLVRGFVERVEICCADECVAVHARSYGQGQYVLDPRHFLRLLQRKPGSLDNARPFKNWDWGEDLTIMRRELEYRYGGSGTKKFIAILLLFLEHTEDEVQRAVRRCVQRCAWSDEAVRNVLRSEPVTTVCQLDLSARPELLWIGSEIRPASLYDRLRIREEVPA